VYGKERGFIDDLMREYNETRPCFLSPFNPWPKEGRAMGQLVSTSVFLMFAFVVTTAAVASFAADEAASSESVNIPGGVADAKSAKGFVTNPKAGIDAVDLNDGHLLWSASDGSNPIFVSENRLFAYGTHDGKRNVIRLVVLDTSAGKRLLKSESIAFPSWVDVEPSPGHSFAARPHLDGQKLVMTWEAHARYAGGANPPPEVVKRATKDATGQVQIDIKDGAVQEIKETNAEAGKQTRPPGLEDVESSPYQTSLGLETKPLIVGNRLKVLATKETATGDEKLFLKSWDLKSGKEAGEIELTQGKDLSSQVTLDGRSLLVHEPGAEKPSPWLVFSLETGKQIAKIQYVEGARQVSLVGPRALFAVTGDEGQTIVRSVDLESGRLLWERLIKGPRPMRPRP
jgi:hypothetical protein